MNGFGMLFPLFEHTIILYIIVFLPGKYFKLTKIGLRIPIDKCSNYCLCITMMKLNDHASFTLLSVYYSNFKLKVIYMVHIKITHISLSYAVNRGANDAHKL